MTLLNLSMHIINTIQHGNCLYGINALVGLYQRSRPFASIARSISDSDF